MKTALNTKFKTVDEYFSTLPENVRDILSEWRKIIREAAPQAEETISYNMSAFRQNGMLVWYAANKNHIGLYPKPSVINAFKKELADYRTSKGAIQFPIEKAIPADLIKKIIRFRVNENLKKG